MKKRILALVLVFALALALGIGGTVAWLTATTNEITNTFTVGDINISLAETVNNAFDFVPGDTLKKDPKVTVDADSEACYLFVKVVDNNNVIDDDNNNDKIIDWAIADDWEPVADHDGYWVRTVAKGAGADGFSVLKNDNVKVSDEVTKDMVGKINAAKPTITVVAAAVQQDNVSNVAAAWAKLPTAFTGETSGT